MLRIITLSTFGLCLAGALPAFAQSSQGPLPPDIDPESLSRLPALTRADLDADGQAIYDRVVGDDPPPKTGPRAVMLYSPVAGEAFDDLNGFLRYNGDL